MRTRQQFDAELTALDIRMREMGNASQLMLERSIHALTRQDSQLAMEVIKEDDVVDEHYAAIEAECMRLVIQQQPVAHDLRFIGMVYKAIDDIERIADHSVDIAMAAIEIDRETHYEPLVDIIGLADRVSAMFTNSLLAFANHDLALARKVLADDDEVDDMFHSQRATLIGIMQRKPELMDLVTHLVFVVQFLERIGDRSVNIAERVHQMENGTLPNFRTVGATP